MSLGIKYIIIKVITTQIYYNIIVSVDKFRQMSHYNGSYPIVSSYNIHIYNFQLKL